MNWLTNLVRTPANAHLTREELQVALEKAQEPAYKAAMRFGEKGIDHPEFKRLAISEQFQDAMKIGENKFLDLLASERNHGDAITANGKFTLEYWDLVKKSLDDKIGKAVRSGEKNEAANLTQMKNNLLSVLDDSTTLAGRSLYKDARGIHAAFRGADNAIEAGESLVKTPMAPNQLRSLFNKAKPEERTLISEGYVSALKDKLGHANNRRSVDQILKDTPYAKENLEILLGPLGAREFQARMMVENTFNRLRGALGNSTTARQLIENGLITGGSGASLYSLYNSDPNTLALSGMTSALAYGSKRANQRVARIVAEKLLSQDPKIVQQGFNQIRNNKTLMQNLTNYENALTKYLALNPPAANSLNPVKADQEPPQ